jgi:hypothetical protein
MYHLVVPGVYTPTVCVTVFAVLQKVIPSDENGWERTEKPYFYFRLYIFFDENGNRFGKCGFENGIGISRHTETNKYRWRAEKLN